MDLFEYMHQKIGCSYISDLHYYQYDVLKCFKQIDYSQYSRKEFDDFCQYVFNQNYDDFLKNLKKD